MIPARLRAAIVVRPALLAVSLLVACIAPTLAADPIATAAPVPPKTCAERYPADGPGGVDLALGCVVSELVGFYSEAAAWSGAEPARISAYLAIAAMLAAIGVLVVVLARRVLGRRMVSASPMAFWSCPACRSVNPAGAEACYRCKRPWDADVTAFHTDLERPAPQSFGRRHDGR